MFNNYSKSIFNEFCDREVFNNNAPKKNLDFFLVWSFHNNSVTGHSNLLNKVIKDFSKTRFQEHHEIIRYLPEHNTNLGHLGYLFLYVNYYRNFSKKRQLVIWPELSPNRYYLDKLIEIIPLKVTLLKGSPKNFQLEKECIDTLQYSKIDDLNWRLEVSAAIPTDQEFPELEITNEFKLSSNDDFTDIAFSQLAKIGFDTSKWFAILHVKEHRFGFDYGGETRDSSIESYDLACDLITELGGQVIRMGGPNFPRLNKNFHAIDYAHSDVRSNQLDFWLWANCELWFGNSNGAAVAVIPFKKPRLITNLWPIHNFGPSTDFYLPKLILDNKRSRIIFPEELMSMKISRTMSRKSIVKEGLRLIENTPESIRDAILELYSSNNSREAIENASISDFEKSLINSMNGDKRRISMKIPQSFEKFINVFGT
jgi:putative glycosyltransferase (TIGR04372 family)